MLPTEDFTDEFGYLCSCSLEMIMIFECLVTVFHSQFYCLTALRIVLFYYMFCKAFCFSWQALGDKSKPFHIFFMFLKMLVAMK